MSSTENGTGRRKSVVDFSLHDIEDEDEFFTPKP